MTNEEWLKSLSTEELAEELARIAEWDREQVKKAKRTVGIVVSRKDARIAARIDQRSVVV